MKVSLMVLFSINQILSKHLLGIDINTQKKERPNLKLPESMKRHLRRVMEACRSEIGVADPGRVEFIEKWKVYGEKKDEFPKETDENYAQFQKEYADVFYTQDLVIPFAPFKVELLDDFNEVVPDEITNLMYEMNGEYEVQNKEEQPPRQGDDKGPSSPTPNA